MSELQDRTMTEQKREYIAGLRAMADHLERCKLDDETFADWNGIALNIFRWSEDSFKEVGRLLGGRREKVLEGAYAMQRLRFGPHKIEVNVQREAVCEKVEVGTRVVPAQPAQPEREEPVYEWRCEGYEES